MILFITGASHTGKTLLAQRVLERYGFPYLSMDHLKMGLIRSGQTALTPTDDRALTAYLWPIVREMVKTAIENGQNLTVEGGYIPFDWQKDFDAHALAQIRFLCLVMTEEYIAGHFADIMAHANDIETRLADDCSPAELMEENRRNLEQCKAYGLPYRLIDGEYDVEFEL